MKRLLILLGIVCFSPLFGATLSDEGLFRAMQEEMQRSLKHLRLKDHPLPYYIAYQLTRLHQVDITANMGTVIPEVYDPADASALFATVFVSVGSDKQDGLGFLDTDLYSWNYYQAQLAHEFTYPSYEAIRQRLWQLTVLHKFLECMRQGGHIILGD